MAAQYITTVIISASLMLGACVPQAPSALAELRTGPTAPKGTIIITEAVDGLIVGHRLMAAGEYELALRAYTRGAAVHGLNADVLSALGSANLKLGRLGQAKKLLRRAVELDEKFVPAWNNLGVLLSNEGKYKEARRVFQLAYGLDSGNSEEIRENLTKIIAKDEKTSYTVKKQKNEFDLVRRGNGRYLLLKTASST